MKKAMAAIALCLLLTGCWDELQLKKLLFVDVIGVDYEGNSKQLNVNFVISSLRNASQGGGDTSGQYLQSTGVNLYDAVNKSNKVMPGILSVLETRLYLITPRFAKDQPLDYLNMTSQFLSNPLYAYLAVYDGDLPELLAKKKIKDQTVSDYLVGLLDDEKKRGKIPTNKVLHYILGGKDFVNDFALNRFEPHEKGVRLSGTSLFSDGKYTGVNLNDDETLLATLMGGTGGANQAVFGKIEGENYSILVQDAKRDFRIVHNANELQEIEISLKLNIKLLEDSLDAKKHTKEKLAKLEKDIAADLTTRSSTVIAALQKANCDFFQLGHEVAAYHPKLFEGMDWRAQYPKVSVKPIVKIKLLNTGILE